MLTMRVIPSRTSAAYISAPTSAVLASAKWLVSNAARVLAGENSDQLITLALPASIASAIVSPSARPKPRLIAPKMPVAAVGMKIARIASQRVSPIPKAASRILGGTATNASREIAVIVGSTLIASTQVGGQLDAGKRAAVSVSRLALRYLPAVSRMRFRCTWKLPGDEVVAQAGTSDPLLDSCIILTFRRAAISCSSATVIKMGARLYATEV